MERFRRMRTANAELQSEIEAEQAQNEHLLRRIDGLNDALGNVPGCEDIARLEEDFDVFSAEKRNLEDGIVTLQQQLPLLLSQEKKLGNLLRDQQSALEGLEQKIEEVKLLQEAYENEFQANMKDETQSPLNKGPVCDSQSFSKDQASGTPPPLYGTWDCCQAQTGKRHRLN